MVLGYFIFKFKTWYSCRQFFLPITYNLVIFLTLITLYYSKAPVSKKKKRSLLKKQRDKMHYWVTLFKHTKTNTRPTYEAKQIVATLSKLRERGFVREITVLLLLIQKSPEEVKFTVRFAHFNGIFCLYLWLIKLICYLNPINFYIFSNSF